MLFRALDSFGDTNQVVFNQNLITSLVFIKGDTAYKPPDYEIRITPVFNYNKVEVEERRILFITPERGTEREDKFVGWQELFLDKHQNGRASCGERVCRNVEIRGG